MGTVPPFFLGGGGTVELLYTTTRLLLLQYITAKSFLTKLHLSGYILFDLFYSYLVCTIVPHLHLMVSVETTTTYII